MRSEPTALVSTASVSTHVLDTAVGRPAQGVPVLLAFRSSTDGAWQVLGGSTTDGDGRCQDLPVPPAGTTHVRLEFRTEEYYAGEPAPRGAAPSGADRREAVFFPEVTVAFAVNAGEHHHVPLLLSPFSYSVYRGS
ncbi:hydroxyisourate hydrolase [Streptomyces sp. NPDC059076]|uniref:hydroxyisourate hydrolase n=1 Tax=unclassified Streptomyces TaxID=2593676 RepID=UPI00369020D4